MFEKLQCKKKSEEAETILHHFQEHFLDAEKHKVKQSLYIDVILSSKNDEHLNIDTDTVKGALLALITTGSYSCIHPKWELILINTLRKRLINSEDELRGKVKKE